MLFNRINIFFVLVSSFMFIIAVVLAYFSFTDSIENFMFFSLFWALLWIGFLWLGYKLWKSNSLIVDWYRILTNWKYKWDWSNWTANWNWEFILSDWTVLKWLFKNWKLNWKWRIIDINWEVLDSNFIDWVCNWKFKLVFPTWESLIWNFVWWRKNWECKHIFKDWCSLSWNYVDDLPQWEFTIVTSDWSVFKSHYVHWKSVWELIPVDISGDSSLKDVYSNIDIEKLKQFLAKLHTILDKYLLDLDNLIKNEKNKSNKSFVEVLTENINECKNNLIKLSDTDSVLKEILEKDIDNLEKSREKIDSFNWDESQKVIYHIYATNRVNWYFDLVKSVFKKHGVKLRDKSKYSYWEYYHNLQRLTKSFNNFIVKSHNAISYVNNIRNFIAKSDDPNIYDEVLLNVDKLYKDYYHQYKKFIDINDSLEIYFNDFWKFHIKW